MNCLVADRGLTEYPEGLRLQEAARQQVQNGVYDGILLLLEHWPVITVGRAGGRENLRPGREKLPEQAAVVHLTDRGGNITCHNPGQIVGYPIFNLSRWRQDAHWYVGCLEEVLIRVLADYGLAAGRKACYTGVWVGNEKIAAIGVSIRRWITGHGFAMNVANDLSLFEVIVPCGIRDFGVTSMVRAGVNVTPAEVKETVIREFGQIFACDWGR